MKYKPASPQSATLAFVARPGMVSSANPEPAAGGKQLAQSENPHKANSHNWASLLQFDRLPDTAYVRLPVVLALFGCSRATWYRWVKSGRVPATKKLGLRLTAWQVGALRAALKTLDHSGQVNSIGEAHDGYEK